MTNKKTSHKCEVYIYRIQVIPEWIFYAACPLSTKTKDGFLKDLGPNSSIYVSMPLFKRAIILSKVTFLEFLLVVFIMIVF